MKNDIFCIVCGREPEDGELFLEDDLGESGYICLECAEEREGMVLEDKEEVEDSKVEHEIDF